MAVQQEHEGTQHFLHKQSEIYDDWFFEGIVAQILHSLNWNPSHLTANEEENHGEYDQIVKEAFWPFGDDDEIDMQHKGEG